MSLTSAPAPAAAPAGTGLTTGGIVWRAVLAGALAGLIAGVVAYLLGEPGIDAAIEIEEAAAAAEGAAEEDELVSRAGQVFGLFLALVLSGAALGVLLGLAVAGLREKTAAPLARIGAWAAAAGWLAIAAVPMVLYPANPPAVGEPDTIGMRTWMWVAAVVVGALAVAAAITTRRGLGPGSPTARWILPIVAFALVVVIGRWVLPAVDEVEGDFPATLLWDFRLASAATTATLWLGLAALFGLLVERSRTR